MGSMEWKTGRYRFCSHQGMAPRVSIRFGKQTKRRLQTIKNYMDDVVTAKKLGVRLEERTIEWLSRLDTETYCRIAEAGLVKPRQAVNPQTVKAFIVDFLSKKAFCKKNTKRNYLRTASLLTDFLGDLELSCVTPGLADEYKEHLLANYSPATVGREVKRARQFFESACRHRLISENPFANLQPPSQVNTSRNQHVSAEDIHRVIEACPSCEWRALIAMARFAGLRIPSEITALKWEDINFETRRITIHSPKTEHHTGGESRVIPIFKKLQPFLSDLWESCDEGEVYVFPRLRQQENLRTQLLRIIKRACVNRWPRLFQNLRASCESDLAREYGAVAACEWIGNSLTVASQHYLHLTDLDFDRATGIDQPASRGKMRATAGQKAGQQGAARRRTTTHLELANIRKALQTQSFCVEDGIIGTLTIPTKVPPRGVEPLSPP